MMINRIIFKEPETPAFKYDSDDFISDFEDILLEIKLQVKRQDYEKFADRLIITILESKED